MNRVCGDVHVPVAESDVDDYKVVDVIQVITNLSFLEFASATSNYKISRCTAGDLAGNMARYMELAISPAEL
jgi:hypothetical protein